jgi:four helix bundle protein
MIRILEPKMASIKRFEDLQVWIDSRELYRYIWKLIQKQGLDKQFRLVSQIEAAAGSIMDNIAEGFERGNRNEFILFLGYAKGSCAELRSQLYRLLDTSRITEQEFDVAFKQTLKVSAQLQKFISYLQQTTVMGTRTKHRMNK